MKYLPFIFAIFFLASCEKEIFIDLNEADTRLVIEGNITNEAIKHTIKITKTVSFSSSNSYPTVASALVTLSDNAGWTETLTETSAGIYQTSILTGQEGETYTLTVVADGKTYTASSKMPTAVPLKDLRIEKSTFGTGAGSRTAEETFYVVPLYDDPALLGNNYRFLQSIGNKKDKSYIIFNDNVSNGLTNERPIFSQGFEIKKGNELTVEMRCIDKLIYDYFFALSSLEGQGPGGGTTPANPTSNIKGGALGYFSAHTVQRKTITVP
jgi:hypothetical protein